MRALPLVIGDGFVTLDNVDGFRMTLDDGRLVSVDVYETRAGWAWGVTVGSGKGLPSREAAVGEAEAFLYDVRVRGTVRPPTVPQSILAVLADGRAAYAYQLARAVGRPIRRVYVALNRLRIRGVVERTGVRGHYRYWLAQPMDKS